MSEEKKSKAEGNAASTNSAWSMIKLGLILAAYAVASCTVLAIVNSFTAPVIARNNQAKADAGMKAVFETADSFADPETALKAASSATVKIDKLKLAMSDGKVVGAVIQVTGPTYDHSTIVVGMDLDGTVTGMKYLENTDTPGFGLKASDPTFTLASGKTFFGQFAGKKASDGFKAGETFDAISGATITSNGVATLMNEATKAMSDILEAYK